MGAAAALCRGSTLLLVVGRSVLPVCVCRESQFMRCNIAGARHRCPKPRFPGHRPRASEPDVHEIFVALVFQPRALGIVPCGRMRLPRPPCRTLVSSSRGMGLASRNPCT
jgi:hypothetical protein